MARPKNPKNGPVYFTTDQVRKALGVSLPTVVNWVNSGLLSAHRTAGGHRRIARLDLVEFCQKKKYPLPKEFLTPGTSRGRILVVDDDPDFAEMLREYLTLRGGLETEVANSGFQAGLSVARFKPDLIIMDLMMPDMDGFEVYRTLRGAEETRHIPVLACTAYHDEAMARRIREAEFHGQVEKPCRLDALLDQIRQYLPSA